jgi:voltage-gated potassium channel
MTNKAVLDEAGPSLTTNNQEITCSKTSGYSQQLRHPAWQLCMLILSIYALASLSLETLVITDPEISNVLVTVDLMICLVFLTDFLFLFFTASSKWSYMVRWGWIDLISSIPMADPLRWGRLARVVRIVSILRAVKSIRVIGDTIKVSPFETLSVMTFVIVFVSISVSAGLILEFERGFDSQLKSSSDALWWSFLSVMNAKAGFHLPVSPEGIFNTVYLNKVGLLLFAYINGSVVAWLVSNRSRTASVVEE